MKSFIIKTINVVLICSILYGYQQYATVREKEVAAYEKESLLAEQAWRESRSDSIQEDVRQYSDGTYEGSGIGFGGEIVVQVQIKKGAILSAEIISADNETPDYIEEAKKVLDYVVEKQSVDVDTVSGATLSSNGILEGVQNALKQAQI